jgi:hypothetical protein
MKTGDAYPLIDAGRERNMADYGVRVWNMLIVRYNAEVRFLPWAALNNVEQSLILYNAHVNSDMEISHLFFDISQVY